MVIFKKTKGGPAFLSMPLFLAAVLSMLLLSPTIEYQRRKLFLIGTWFTPAHNQTLILKSDGSFQEFDERGNPTYEGTYKLRGFSHLSLQSLAYTDEGGRRRRFNTSETMESFDSGLSGLRIYIPLYGDTMYSKLEVEFGSPSASKNNRIYRMERR